MNFPVNFLLLLTILCSTIIKANTSHLAPEGRLIGGHEATPHSHPYLVSLQARFLWIRAHICAGALLNENWILSAGHCITESWLIRWLPMDAIVGTHNIDRFSPGSQVANIAQRISHPQYSGGIGPYDIAMLKTKTPFILTKQVRPIHLPEFGTNHREKSLVLTGWGALKTTLFIPDLPSKLQEVQVTYIPHKECYQALEDLKEGNEENPLDRNANICTGPLTGGVAACSGDSGGPLIQYISNGVDEPPSNPEQATETPEYGENDYEHGTRIEERNEKVVQKHYGDGDRIPVVLGVVSWGISPCGEKGAPTVYTNVSTYMDFIYKHIYD